MAAAAPSGAAAQTASTDPRILTVDYRGDQVIPIEAAPGFQLMMEFAPDEQIQSIAVGDSRSWQITAARGASLLFVKPVENGSDTNMTVVTSLRAYLFDLRARPASSSAAPYRLRFRYPPPPTEPEERDTAEIGRRSGLYRISGAPALRPAAMSDDGAKTYIDWPPDGPLPAVFIIDSHGDEQLADGHMRGGLFVIDSVHGELLFRVDRLKARARRIATEAGVP